MKRRLHLILAILFALLSLGLAVLWPVSHLRTMALTHWGPNARLLGELDGGEVCVLGYRGDCNPPELGWRAETREAQGPREHPIDLFPHGAVVAGFALACGQTVPFGFRFTNVVTGAYVAVPIWFCLLLSAFLSWWFWRLWRKARLLPGHCRKCGYDLRASKNTCPECGTAIPADLARRPAT